MPSERRLAAIMFTDIVGYTVLMAHDEEAARRARDRHEAVVRPRVEEYHGGWIERTGDETLSSFPSALDAVNCALAVQSDLEGDTGLRVRIGIHQGDVTFDESGVSGDGVNVAARIRPLAEPGGIVISDEVHHSVQGRPDLEFAALGEQRFKNVDRTVAVYAVGREGTVHVARSATARGSLRGWTRYAGAALAVAVVLAVGARWIFEQVIAPRPAIRSIAVLPLENLSGDPEQEYFVDGMTEVLIANLARVRGLRVISRTSSMAYRNSGKTLPVIARELNVDAIVEGSVLRAGDRVRITAQLIEASSDVHLWSDSYSRDLQDVLALQGEVARAIASEIELQLSGPDEPGETARPVDPGAFEAYLKGRHHWNKRTGADLQKSIEYFETAIALDPDWALAHSGLAEAYVLLAFYDPSSRPRDSMPRARAAAERALELDDELAPAHTALAAVREWYDWDWEGAEAEFQRALELDPSYATAHHWYAIHRMVTEQKGAIEHMQRARELDPLSMVIGTVTGMVLLYSREYDRSIEVLRETLELDPSFRSAQVNLAEAYAAKGMHKEAVEVAERRARTEESVSMVALARAYAGAGRREDALRILEEVRGSAIQPLNIAYVYAALGEADAAFDWLEKAYERRSLPLTWVQVNPASGPLRSDPRFDDLLRRIGFPES
jgi:TolB-like protein/class 3 adenylate cyclase/Tfp pilus assembly protein PilF